MRVEVVGVVPIHSRAKRGVDTLLEVFFPSPVCVRIHDLADLYVLPLFSESLLIMPVYCNRALIL